MGYAIMWLIVAIVAGAIDVLTSNFFFILFSIGSIVAAVCAGLGISFLHQVIIFAIVSLIVMMFGYPWLKKKYKVMHKRIPLMEETYIGRVIVADQEIKNKAQIKVGGEYWTAINEGDIIHKEEKFEIIGIDGIKLRIKKVLEE
ncbi:MAG: NfeD family protein [Clostridium butyricum]|nr:NfeD family protein [Clostridium butyricum]